MKLYQQLAIVGTTLFELFGTPAYAAPPQPVQPVQPETSVCLPLSEFERLCLPKPKPNQPHKPSRPKVPQDSGKCDQFFEDNHEKYLDYTGACITDPSKLKENEQIDIIEGPRNLCPGTSRCYGIKVRPQEPKIVEKIVEKTVEKIVPVPDKGAQDKIDELTKLVKERLPSVPALTSGPTLSVYGSEEQEGMVGFNAGYAVQIAPRLRLGIKCGYVHISAPELKETVTTSGQTHDLPAGIQEIVSNMHTAQSYRGQDRGTVGIEANIALYDGPVLRIDADLGLEAVIYKTGEGSKDQRDAYLIQNGQRTTDTKTATAAVPIDPKVTADITSYVDLSFLFDLGKGVRLGPFVGLGVTFPNMDVEDVRVGGKYGVKGTYEF